MTRETHGVYKRALNPIENWPESEQLLVTEVANELQTPALIEEHLRYRVAQGLVILQVLEAYLAQQSAAGIPLDELTIMGRWPAFQNSVLRGLKQVQSVLAEKPDPDDLISLKPVDD